MCVAKCVQGEEEEEKEEETRALSILFLLFSSLFFCVGESQSHRSSSSRVQSRWWKTPRFHGKCQMMRSLCLCAVVGFLCNWWPAQPIGPSHSFSLSPVLVAGALSRLISIRCIGHATAAMTWWACLSVCLSMPLRGFLLLIWPRVVQLSAWNAGGGRSTHLSFFPADGKKEAKQRATIYEATLITIVLIIARERPVRRQRLGFLLSHKSTYILV